MPKDKIYDVVIIGGGHMGLTLGEMLANAGIESVIIERREFAKYVPNGDPSRLLAIADGSIKTFQQHNINLDFDKIGQEIKRILTIESGVKSGFLEFNPADINVANFGYMIEEQELAYALYEHSKTLKKLHAIYNNPVVNLQQDQDFVTIDLENGEQLKARLAIAADGKRSKIRDLLGIETFEKDYHQYALVCDVKHELPHEGLAIEKFLPQGPFASLPKIGGNTSSIVWTVGETALNMIKKLDNNSLLPLLEERFDGCFGEIEIVSTIKVFKLERVLAQKYFAGRVALLGDALHAIHPLAGQGLNLSMRDAQFLCEAIIKQKKLGLDVGSHIMLESYQSERKVDNTIMSEATDVLNSLFSNNSNVLSYLRKTGLNMVDSAQGLKKIFMEYASGK